MKNINFTLLLCLLFNISVLAQRQTHKQWMGLKGNIQSVETYSINVTKEGRFDESNRQHRTLVILTSKGELKEQISFNEQGTIRGKILYSFDSKGNHTGYKSYYPFDDKTPPTTQAYENSYDNKGNLFKIKTIYSTSDTSNTTDYKFDEKGNNIEISFGTSPLARIDKYKYDRNGNLIESLRYTQEILRYKTVVTYDKKNRILTREVIAIKPITWFGGRRPDPGKVVYDYDDARKEAIVHSYYPDNSLKERAIFNYDKRGNPIKVTSQFFATKKKPNGEIENITGSIRISQYEYDAQNNWIKRTSYIQPQKDSPIVSGMMEVRIIKYIK